MKKLFIILFFSISSFVVFGQQDNEHIISYDVDIYVLNDGSLEVSEKIKVYAAGKSIQRGIFRTLPQKRVIFDKTAAINYDIISVKRDGKAERYHIEKSKETLAIYIGDKYKRLWSGEYEYELIYRVNNQVKFFKDFDEVYWNVTGNEWNFNIDEVTARIHLPSEALQYSCYTGVFGSSETNCEAKLLDEYTLEWTAGPLAVSEGLSVAVGFEKGAVIQTKTPFYAKLGLLGNILIILLLSLLLVMYYLWNKHGRDFEKPTVYPQFNVPHNYSPASLAYIYNEKLTDRNITTSIINLATKNYIKIQELTKTSVFSKPSYYLSKLKDPDSSLPQEEKILMEGFFSGSRTIVGITGSYSPLIEDVVKKYKRNLDRQNYHFINEGNNLKFTAYIFLAASIIYWLAYGMVGELPYNASNKSLANLSYILSIGYFIALVVFPKPDSKYLWIGPSLFFGLLIVFVSKNGFVVDLYVFATTFISITMMFLGIFNYLIMQPTKKFQAAKSLVEGFKMYLVAAESEMVKFFNPPKMTPELFEKYLPYAIAMGVEGVWGRKFEQSLVKSATTYENHWYTGGVGSGNISSGMIGGLANGFSSSMARSATAPSSSSGGSGSGGGGYSGGGGGGGGGGGW